MKRQAIGVVLAGGRSTRMKSGIAKLVHELCGRPLVSYVANALKDCGVKQTIIVVGFDEENVKRALGEGFIYVRQAEQSGTGHAVHQAEPILREFEGDVVVVPGDAPFLDKETLSSLLEQHQEKKAEATVLTAVMPDPRNYGRIVRGRHGEIIKIVERKDAALEEIKIQEVNSGAYCFDCKRLLELLPVVAPHNVQDEYYLTDVIGLMFARNMTVETIVASDYRVMLAVNNRCELAEALRVFRERVMEELMLSGVTIMDPGSTYVDTTVKVGRDTIIYPFSFIEKNSEIGTGCTIGPHTRLSGAQVGDDARVESSVVVESTVESGAHLGPYAHLRRGVLTRVGG